MNLEEVLATYTSLRKKGKSEKDIYPIFIYCDDRILSRVFSVEFCLTKQDAFHWGTILECNPTRRSFILNSVSPVTRGIIYAPEFID